MMLHSLKRGCTQGMPVAHGGANGIACLIMRRDVIIAVVRDNSVNNPAVGTVAGLLLRN